MSVAFFALSRVLPLYHCPIALTGWGTIGLFGMGLGAMASTDQTFIPASNSTTDRGERPDSKGQWIESRQSVTSNLKERKTDLVNYPLITPPPLLLQTVHGPLYCDLFKTYCSIWWMLNLI